MNSNFDGGQGMYGAVVVGALAELGALLSKVGQRPAGQSWKRSVLMLAVVVTPVVVLLASGSGF